MEYIKFWIMKELVGIGIVLSVFAVIGLIFLAIIVFYKVKDKAERAAEKWNEIYSDSKEEK